MMTFKEKLVVLRKIKHLTQDEFASAVGVSRQAVYKWESGQSYPEVQKLIEMKLLFGISIDDLLDDTFEIELPKKKKKRRSKKAEAEETVQEVQIKEEQAPVAAALSEVKEVEVKPEPKLEIKPEPKPEIKPEVKPEVKPEPKPLPKEEVKEVLKEEQKPTEKKEEEAKPERASVFKKGSERTSLFERLFGSKK